MTYNVTPMTWYFYFAVIKKSGDYVRTKTYIISTYNNISRLVKSNGVDIFVIYTTPLLIITEMRLESFEI
jgi:hypothetical protein